MNEAIRKAKDQLQAGDIKSIAESSGISYQTIYKVLKGEKSKKQTQIIAAVADFLQQRKDELKRLESVLN